MKVCYDDNSINTRAKGSRGTSIGTLILHTNCEAEVWGSCVKGTGWNLVYQRNDVKSGEAR